MVFSFAQDINPIYASVAYHFPCSSTRIQSQIFIRCSSGLLRPIAPMSRLVHLSRIKFSNISHRFIASILCPTKSNSCSYVGKNGFTKRSLFALQNSVASSRISTRPSVENGTRIQRGVSMICLVKSRCGLERKVIKRNIQVSSSDSSEEGGKRY